MTNERELINRAQNGDASAFEELITEYQTVVFNVALKILSNYEDASDMSQEALIKAYKNIGKFEGKSKFSTWLYKITYNVCIDKLRARKKFDAYSIDETFDDSNDLKLDLVDSSPTPEQYLENMERANALHNAINSLSNEHRIAIILRDVNGFTYDEIAQIQSCSLGTVKSRINRARNQLKEIISKEMEQNTVVNVKNNRDRRRAK